MASTEITKNILQYEKTSIDAPPLDFSYKEIKKLDDIKQIEPRLGKRKPIQKEDEEIKDEKKKVDENEVKANEKEEKKDSDGQGGNQDQENNTKTEQKEGEEEEDTANQEGGGEQKDNIKEQEDQNNKEKDATQGKDKKQDNKVPEIVKIMPQNNNFNINSIIQQSNISLQAQQQKNQSSKNQYGGAAQFVQKKVVKIKTIQTSLLLSYNQIRNVETLYKVMDSVMEDCNKLQWIDLSHNYLTKLNYNFSDFPNLKSLYLHCNYLYDMADIQQLFRPPNQINIRSLTVHGNPIERISNFRLFIIGLLPFLQRLDTVLITKKERDNSSFIRNQFKNRKLPEVKELDLEKPPEEVVLQEKDGSGSGAVKQQ